MNRGFRFTLCGVEIAEFLREHSAVYRGRKPLQKTNRLGERPAIGPVKIEQAQVTPFHELVLSLLQLLCHFIDIAAERQVQRLAHDGSLPRQDRLGGQRGFAESISIEKKSSREDRDVRRAGKIWLVDGPHRDGNALDRKRVVE